MNNFDMMYLLSESYAKAEISGIEHPDNDYPNLNDAGTVYNRNRKYYGSFRGKHNIMTIRHDPQGRMIMIRWWKCPSKSKNPKMRDKPNQFLVHYLGKKKIMDSNQLNVFMNRIKVQNWNGGFPNDDLERQNMRRYLHLYQKYGGGQFEY